VDQLQWPSSKHQSVQLNIAGYTVEHMGFYSLCHTYQHQRRNITIISSLPSSAYLSSTFLRFKQARRIKNHHNLGIIFVAVVVTNLQIQVLYYKLNNKIIFSINKRHFIYKVYSSKSKTAGGISHNNEQAAIYLQPFSKYEEGLETLIAEDLPLSPLFGVPHSLKSSMRRSTCKQIYFFTILDI